jgi:hypothetical protein
MLSIRRHWQNPNRRHHDCSLVVKGDCDPRGGNGKCFSVRKNQMDLKWVRVCKTPFFKFLQPLSELPGSSGICCPILSRCDTGNCGRNGPCCQQCMSPVHGFVHDDSPRNESLLRLNIFPYSRTSIKPLLNSSQSPKCGHSSLSLIPSGKRDSDMWRWLRSMNAPELC